MRAVDNLPSSSLGFSELPAVLEVCQVCGKPAAGQHYGVKSCHGCKSFFRRAFVKSIRYPECSRGKTCYDNNFLRSEASKKCNKCRIKKCYRVGMVSQDNRSHQRTKPSLLPQKCFTKDEDICILIDQLSHLDLQIDNFRKSAYNPVITPTLEQIIQSPSQLNLAQNYGPMKGWPFTPKQYFEKQLAAQELMNGNNCDGTSIKIVDGTLSFDTNLKHWLIFDIMAAIEYAKTFNFFHKLSNSDKLALVQSTTVMNMYLTSTFQSFSMNMDEVYLPDGISVSCVLRTIANSDLAFREQKSTNRILGPLIREKVDQSEYLLLKAIILCNSLASNLSPSGQRIVDYERHKYCSALFSYCRTRHGDKNGPARFYTILSLIGVLLKTHDDFRLLVLLVSLCIQERLMIPQNECFLGPKLLQHELMDF